MPIRPFIYFVFDSSHVPLLASLVNTLLCGSVSLSYDCCRHGSLCYRVHRYELDNRDVVNELVVWGERLGEV